MTTNKEFVDYIVGKTIKSFEEFTHVDEIEIKTIQQGIDGNMMKVNKEE